MIHAKEAFTKTQKVAKIYSEEELSNIIKENIRKFADSNIEKHIQSSISCGAYSHTLYFPKNSAGDHYKLGNIIKPFLKRIHPSNDVYEIALTEFLEYLKENGYIVSCNDCGHSENMLDVVIRWDNLEYLI
jgi:hypothetical protein